MSIGKVRIVYIWLAVVVAGIVAMQGLLFMAVRFGGIIYVHLLLAMAVFGVAAVLIGRKAMARGQYCKPNKADVITNLIFLLLSLPLSIWGFRSFLYGLIRIEPLLLAMAILAIVAVLTGRKAMTGGASNKPNWAGVITNFIFSLLYISLSFFGFLSLLASDGIDRVSSQPYLALVMAYMCISVSTPLICVDCIVASMILRAHGRRNWSLAIQFLPILTVVGAYGLYMLRNS